MEERMIERVLVRSSNFRCTVALPVTGGRKRPGGPPETIISGAGEERRRSRACGR